MAATSHPLATQVALDVLKDGGNAIDAAIAANATLGLMEPTGCGIGGDLFAIIWSEEEQKLFGLNASGRSPAGLDLAYFQDHDLDAIPTFGPLSVSVPGCVDGWFQLHQKFGRMPLEKILAPAIAYAQNGFPVTELIAHYLEINARRFLSMPGFAHTYMPGGKTPAKGEVFKNPDLAKTYQRIAKQGRDAFYAGAIAEIIAKSVQNQGGFLSADDLKNHTSEWVDPVSVNYRGYEVFELPPNGQGIAALQMLNILEGYDLRAMGFGSPDYLHTLIEAKKLAYADRARYYGDPDFSAIPVEELISKAYADKRRHLIDPLRAADRCDPGDLEHGETIYLTVADQAGNMVSLIQSNYSGMGSGIIPDGLGFMLQNRGALFTLEEGHPNVYAPRKRPFHTIIPAFVKKDGKPWISFGVMGGAMQPQGHVQILVNLVDFGMNLQEAGDAPRIRHIGSSQPTGQRMEQGGTVLVESGITPQTIRDLVMRGHRVEYRIGAFGGYQAIMRALDTNTYYGASESRKDGQAAGY